MRNSGTQWILAVPAVIFLIASILYFGSKQGRWTAPYTTGLKATREANPEFDIEEGPSGRGRYYRITQRSTGRSTRVPADLVDGLRFQFIECPGFAPLIPFAKDPVCMRWQNEFGEFTALSVPVENPETARSFFEEHADRFPTPRFVEGGAAVTWFAPKARQ